MVVCDIRPIARIADLLQIFPPPGNVFTRNVTNEFSPAAHGFTFSPTWPIGF
jgi:hypothetical protein